jgi:hypothetical protein
LVLPFAEATGKRNMPRKLYKIFSISIFCLVFFSINIIAQESLFVYTEGAVDVKDQVGDRWIVEIGDYVETGDTVITGGDGFAEIEKGDYSSIRIAANTVFTYLETESSGEKRDVLSTAFGSVALKFNKLAGTEPYVASGSMVAGVRGTELTVYAGMDGSSLIVVDSGLVEVSSEGKTVALNPQEAVEVTPGHPPGEKFKVLSGQLDFSSWNDGREKEFSADPLAAALNVEKRMEFFYTELDDVLPAFIEKKTRIDTEREKLKKIKADEGEEASGKYYQEMVIPLEAEATGLALNIRYYALSALSFRRFVLGRMYVIMRSTHLTDPENRQFADFHMVHKRIIDTFEQKIVPHLVEADI